MRRLVVIALCAVAAYPLGLLLGCVLFNRHLLTLKES